MPRSTTVLSQRAYLKLVLHAAKYQTRAVMGLLIAQPASSSSSSTSAAASSSLSSPSASLLVTDVLPLFHTAPLAPMIELSLAQAEALLAASYPPSSFIAGLYYAPELFEPKLNHLGEIALPMPQCNVVAKMADKIAANGGALAGTRIILSFERSSSKWQNTGAVSVEDASGSENALEDAVSTLRSILAGEQQRALCDFDDHLDDVKADWTNQEMEKKVLPTMAK